MQVTIEKHLPRLEPNGSIYNPTAPEDKEGRLKSRATIESFERAMQEAVGSQHGDRDAINENGLREHFVGGAYIRELFIPANTAIVSRLWNKDRFWIIATGDVSIMTETGTKRVRGPYTEIPVLGSKTALFTHEDTLWFAITGADANSSEEAEAELLAESYSELKYPWDLIEGEKS